MKKLLSIFLILSLSSSVFAKDVKELYEKCSTCHGDKGEEKAFGKSKEINKLTKKEIIEALEAYKEGTKDEHGLGRIMESQVYSLTKIDIENIAEYIQNFK